MFASIIVKVILPGNRVLFDVKLAPGVTVAQGFFIEMFLTFELVFTILMLAAEVCLLFNLLQGRELTSLENQSNIRRSYRYRSRILHWRTRGRILDRWVGKPSTSIWALCCRTFISWISLDLL